MEIYLSGQWGQGVEIFCLGPKEAGSRRIGWWRKRLIFKWLHILFTDIIHSIDLELLHIFCLNIRSLRKHYDELIIFLSNLRERFIIICLMEEWIKHGEENRYQMDGYDMSLQAGLTTRPAGSLSIQYLNRLNCTVIWILDHELYTSSYTVNVWACQRCIDYQHKQCNFQVVFVWYSLATQVYL